MEQQLETMVQQYQNPIYPIHYRLIGNYFGAQGMAQEIFLSAYKNLPYFDGVNERAWLCKIVTNKCLDYLESTGRRQTPTEYGYFLSLGPQPFSAQSSIEKDYLETGVQKELYDCCCQLKSPYRDVAIDYFYYEMDIDEVVAKTGKNIKTLQTQIYQAKAMLKRLYQKESLRNRQTDPY